MENYKNKQRSLTADNFFSSISLAKQLNSMDIRYVGTLKKNKKEIPWQFLPHKSKEITSSLFGFSEELSSVSYVTKYNKAVLLISTEHHTPKINPLNQNKPEIIEFYNSTKGAVDAFDQKVEKNTCRRKTNIWTFNVMMYILDAAALNAFSLFMLKNKNVLCSDENRARSLYLEALSCELIKFQIIERIRNASINNYSGLNNNLLTSFERVGFKITKFQIRSRSLSSDPDIKKRKLCSHQVCKQNNNKNKQSNICNSCQNFYCSDHCEILKTVICQKCVFE